MDALVEAGARVLGRHGWRGFSTNLVAQTAGASIGTLYQYFPNKMSLLAAIRARHRGAVLEVIDATAREGASLRVRVARLVTGLIAAHQGPTELHRALLVNAPETAASDDDAFEAAYLNAYQSFIARGVRRRRGRLPSPALLAATVEGAIHHGARVGCLDSLSFQAEINALVLGYLRVPFKMGRRRPAPPERRSPSAATCRTVGPPRGR